MPLYSYKCSVCGHAFDMMAPMAEYQDPKPCEKCGEEATRVLGGMPGIIFNGNDFTSKNLRVKRQMREKNAKLARKEREMKGDGMIKQLTPNVDGQVVDSWKEAKSLAKSQGKETSSYDPWIHKEKVLKDKGVV